MQGKELLINTLKNIGLFEKPESDLRDIFDLKTSGKEAFLLGCYGNTPPAILTTFIRMR
jgi:hypothetical protein